MSSAARARIRLSAIRKNFEFLKKVSRGAHIMAVIKANAYGHGLVSVARALPDADCLAVARLSEAKTLRASGIDSPIVVLGGLLAEDELEEALTLRLQFCVHCEEQISWLQNAVTGNAVVWLKIDSGMNRLGFRVEEVESALEKLQNCSRVDELRVMTHLANADDKEDSMTGEQIGTFASAIEGFQGDISIANSAGMLGWPTIDKLFNDALNQGRLWNRPGLSLYGLSPFSDSCGADLGLATAMQLETQIMAVKKLRAGDRVGYGGTWQASEDTVIGLIAAGYGDGYSRSIPTGTPALVNGRRVPIVGRVSMDVSAVDLGAPATDQIGDTVVLWGDELPLEVIARHAHTIPYTLVSGITDRVERIYE